MPDKDQFTFDGDFPVHSQDAHGTSSDEGSSDDSSETDFSANFSEDGPPTADPLEDEFATGVKGGGNPRTRILLMILLLVVVGAAGAYYFMGLGGTTVDTAVVIPAQPEAKSAALPPQPAPVAAVLPQGGPAAKNITIAVPPPPDQPSADAQSQEGPGEQPAGQTVAEQRPDTDKLPGPVPEAAGLPRGAAAQPELTPAAKPVAAAKQAGDGAYALDAGSYLLESNRKNLVEKIKQLGYEPLVTPLDATLNMTRVRIGTFSRDEVREALAFARTIEPSSYSAPAGEGYVIYAGTFLKRDNVDKLSLRFAEEGIKVYPEPVQVVRTLNRVRFGNFATREDAVAASREVGAAGLKAEVVKAK